jgi:tRNA pseudouridine38-40 synthase
MVLDVVADHFLYHMVRNLVGTALALARETDPSGAMRRVLAARDRKRAGVTAPPQGLCLEEVFYAPEGRA